MHLAHGVARQAFHHIAALGHLEIGQLRLEGLQNLLTIDLRALARHDHGHAHLAKVRVRHAHHGAFVHARQIVDKAFDLCRIDVVAARDDQVLAAPHDGEIAASILHAHITGLEPAVVRELFGRLLGHAPVTCKDIGALHFDIANLACGQCLAIVTMNAHAHARQGKAHRAATALVFVAITRIG